MSTRYTVELLDGQTFGPADAADLRAWAHEGRIPPLATIRGDDGAVTRAIDCEVIKDVIAKFVAAPPVEAGSLPQQEDSGVSIVIPYKNQPALWGYYTSIGSLICVVGLIAGPIAIYLGVKGLQLVKVNPKAHGTAHAWVAIILGSLASLLNWGFAVMTLIAALTR